MSAPYSKSRVPSITRSARAADVPTVRSLVIRVCLFYESALPVRKKKGIEKKTYLKVSILVLHPH